MKIAISVESTVDLSKELLKQYNLEMIPFTVLLGETSYLDGDITSQDIFDFVAKEKILPKTSAINDFQYREYFDGLLAKGYDAIIHISLSSEISSSFSHGELASTKYDNVYMIDSRSLSTGVVTLLLTQSVLLVTLQFVSNSVYVKLCTKSLMRTATLCGETRHIMPLVTHQK